MKLSISLNNKKATSQKQPILQASAFGANADDDPNHDEHKVKGPVAHADETSKAMRKRMAAEKQVDATVYEYDEVWDRMKEAKQHQQAAKEADVAARKVGLFVASLVDVLTIN
jgi:coiled-coil domain-containing protein 55